MAILQACNTLNGLGGVLFGVPVNQVSNTPELQAKARQALERSLARPDRASRCGAGDERYPAVIE
jgi:hypothetical protein